MSAAAGGRAPPFGRWERMLALRYLRATRKQQGVALISIISFVGITLAVAVLIIVMSVMNGFRDELLTRILGFNGHLYVSSADLHPTERDKIVRQVKKVAGVRQVTPVIEAQAMALGASQITGAIVRGLTPADLRATKLVSGNITSGSIETFGKGEYGGDEVVVGSKLAEQLGVKPGDFLTLISPTGGATAFGATPQRKSYLVAATFTVGMSQYDQAFIYMPLEQAQIFFGREDQVDVIEVMVDNPDNALKMKPAVQAAAGPLSMVSDWTQRDTSFWDALKVERSVMRLILMLLVVIAAMNIISGLVMLVKNKGRDIAILRTMGAGQGSILRIFFMTGGLIGVAGAAAGLVLGALFCTYIDQIQSVVEWATGQAVFSADVYFLNRVPAKIDWREVALIIGWALAFSFIFSIYPSWRASRIDPVEALRYE